MTLAALDVHYPERGARAAIVTFEAWTASAPTLERCVDLPEVAGYVPGEFYRRELPCLLAALERLPVLPEIVLVDGYVWLENEKPGLGAHLYQALEGHTKVVGVAKTRYAGGGALEVLRGSSAAPLFVGAAGMDPRIAAENVRRMHGPHRIPALLTRVDHLCRGLPV